MKPGLIPSIWMGPFLWAAFAAPAVAQGVVKVSEYAWNELTPSERETIQKSHVVDLAKLGTFGVIIDNQGVDRSTPGTSGGAELGSTLGQAAYIDKALQGGGYSAKEQLAMGILGAIAGSALDSAPTAQYQFRYAVKFSDGAVRYYDQMTSEPFRHAAGVCVAVPNIHIVDQKLCTQTAAELRSAYLTGEAVVHKVQSSTPVRTSRSEPAVEPGPADSTGQVNCKLGNLAPVRTSAEKCRMINGEQVK